MKKFSAELWLFTAVLMCLALIGDLGIQLVGHNLLNL